GTASEFFYSELPMPPMLRQFEEGNGSRDGGGAPQGVRSGLVAAVIISGIGDDRVKGDTAEVERLGIADHENLIDVASAADDEGDGGTEGDGDGDAAAEEKENEREESHYSIK